jgi:hypothetical protein
VVCGYPAAVGPAWLDPLLSYPGRVDVAVHIDPVPPTIAAGMLKRQRARLESTRRLDAEGGKLGDPAVEAAATDAADLAERVARGAAKLFRAGIYLTVHARSLDEPATTSAGVRAAAASVLLDLQPTTFRHHLGYTTTLPLGVDAIGASWTPTPSRPAFPWPGPTCPPPPPARYPAPTRCCTGRTPPRPGCCCGTGGRRTTTTRSCSPAPAPASPTYFVKLEVLRSLYQEACSTEREEIGGRDLNRSMQRVFQAGRSEACVRQALAQEKF